MLRLPTYQSTNCGGGKYWGGGLRSKCPTTFLLVLPISQYKSLSADPSYLLRPYLLPTTQQHPYYYCIVVLSKKYTSTTQTTVRQLPVPVKVMGVSYFYTSTNLHQTVQNVQVLQKVTTKAKNG
jgi:hypothetical protein